MGTVMTGSDCSDSSFMSLPAELREMILSNLLSCDDTLADIPTIVADSSHPRRLIKRAPEELKLYDLNEYLSDTDHNTDELESALDGFDVEDDIDSEDEENFEELETFRTRKSIEDCPIPPGYSYDDQMYIDAPHQYELEELDDAWWVGNQMEHGVDDKYASCRRFKLYPNILRVCRQLYDEGRPLLYTSDKTIEVSFLTGFDNVLHRFSYEYATRSYCMGRRSIKSALSKWPALKEIQNWKYTIYFGPCLRDNGISAQRWQGLYHDLYTLHPVAIAKLTVSFFNLSDLYIDEISEYTDVRNALVSFHTLSCKSGEVCGDVEPWLTEMLQKYLVPKPLMTTIDTMIATANHTHKLNDLLLNCESEQLVDGQSFERYASEAKRAMRGAESDLDLDKFYSNFRIVLDTVDKILDNIHRECDGCVARSVARQKSLHDPKVLAEIREENDRLRMWCPDE